MSKEIPRAIRQFMLLVLLTFWSTHALAQSSDPPGVDRCGYQDYARVIEPTRLLVLSKSEFRVPADFFGRNRTYGCVLVSFDVDQNGKAKNIEVVNYSPSRIMMESAKRTLSTYLFRSDDRSATRKFILFEAGALSHAMIKSDQEQ